mgnify:CR=1 FL=1
MYCWLCAISGYIIASGYETESIVKFNPNSKPFLTLDYKNEELEDLLYNEHYEFIGISSANNFMVDNINKLTIQIRNIIEKKVPVVLGGNLVNTYKKTNEKLKVDLVSQNIEQVLIELNLKYNKNSLKII